MSLRAVSQTLDILLVEDDEDDFVLTRALLSETFGGGFNLDWVTTWDTALEALRRDEFDVCLVDYHLGKWNGLDLIHEAICRGAGVPFIMLTGQDSREIDIEASRVGAADYLVKSQITAPLLERTIRYAQERKKSEERLTTLAQCDGLTGIANRSYFQTRLNDAITQAKRTGSMVAVLLLDLDRFKDINDLHGHPAGDALLVEVAERLVDCIRETDTVGRLGGDEFAVIATNLTHADGAGILARKIIDAIVKPIELDGQKVVVGTSVGISLFPLDDEDPDKLLKNADLALYQTKDQNRGALNFYHAEMNARAGVRKALETDLRRATDERNLFLHYQPILNPHSGDVIAAEALLRWNHAERGLIPPDEFIPIAESSGLIVPLGEHVLKMACAQSVNWHEAGLPAIPIAVNVSALQFRAGKFADTVTRIIAETGADASCLELEITESAIVDNIDHVNHELRRLHEVGIKLAIDDFGTGYSSLAHLKQLPFDKLKIDRTFVHDMVQDPDGGMIVRAVISLGKALGMTVVAEGVETEAQLSFLKRENCDEVQGFYFCRPIPADAFAEWWSEHLRRNGATAWSDTCVDVA